jgi:flagellar FliJ protein
MTSREILLRRKGFQISELGRKIAQAEAVIVDSERLASVLDDWIKAEQDRTRIYDPTHYAYSTYAKATMLRRENLRRTAEKFQIQLDTLRNSLAEAIEEFARLERLEGPKPSKKRSNIIRDSSREPAGEQVSALRS